MILAERLYSLTRGFPHSERYGLSAQLKRAAVSVASNIAEGAARNSTKEYLQFLYVARGSLSEIQTQILLAKRIGLIAQPRDLERVVDDTYRLLNALISSLSRHNTNH